MEDRLTAFAHEVGRDVAKIGGEIARAATDTLHAGEAAIGAVLHDAPEIARKTLDDTYTQLIGKDLAVLRDRHASIAAKAEAAFDLATTFTMPLGKIPAAVGEIALKNLIHEGESTAIAGALRSLQASGDLPALIGVEAALLDADPATATMMKAAGVDSTVAAKTLASIKAAVASGHDLPVSAKGAIDALATALASSGSFRERLASLHSAFGALTTAAADLAALQAGAQTAGGLLLPSSPSPPAVPTLAHAPGGDGDLVRATLAKLSPETIERIQRSGRAEIGLPHLEATPWNGRGQIGSVTSVIGSRVEQYTGAGWTTYDAAHLAPLQAQLAANEVAGDPKLATAISPGDELRVGANGSIDLVPHDPHRPGLQAVHVAPGGQSNNVEPAALQR